MTKYIKYYFKSKDESGVLLIDVGRWEKGEATKHTHNFQVAVMILNLASSIRSLWGLHSE